MDGLELLRAIQGEETLGGIPVVLVSALDQLRALAILNGAAGCLPKPFSLEELVGIVDSLPLGSLKLAS